MWRVGGWLRRNLVDLDVEIQRARSRVLVAQTVHERSPSDAEQPGTQFVAVAKARDPADHAEPDVLEDFSRRVIVARESTHERPQRTVPASDQIVEGGGLSELASKCEQFVVCGSGIDGRHDGSTRVVGDRAERFASCAGDAIEVRARDSDRRAPFAG